jgi:hypothetical protein
MHIPQPRPVPFDDNDGFALEPIPHLGERVPEVLMIQLSQRVHEREGERSREP